VHESLVQGWPSLRRWLDENHDDAALVDQLRTAARQWHAKGRDVGVLWRGDTADEARKLRKRYKGPLSEVERAFLDEVVHEMQAQTRRRRVGVIVGFALLSAIVLAAMVALVIIQRSRAEAKGQQQLAEVAKKEAERQLAAAQAKELERQKFETAKNQAEAVTKTTEGKLVVADATLVEKNKELTDALNVALEAETKEKLERKRAEDSAARAEKSQKEAVASKEAAEKARAETAKLLKKEKDRADRLQQQLGSPAIDDLK
ncbi:MAG: AAA family ATPase, partial [Kofleriaceae bacterium]